MKSAVHCRTTAFGVLAALLLPVSAGRPLCSQETERPELRVATKQTPPFAMLAEDGTWSGITIDLWRSIAKEIGVDYVFVEATIPEMIEGLEARRVSVAAAALTITREREETIDFSHPFFSAGLAIGVPFEAETTIGSILGRLLSLRFLQALGILVLVIGAAGVLVWLFERRRNPEQFGGGILRGLGTAFWWSGVTMTTVGYGDTAPRTVPGRIVSLVWMFTSIVIISGLTATIASVLTVSQLDTGIEGPDDLTGARVGTVEGSTSEAFLRELPGVLRYYYDSPDEAADAVVAGTIDAVVYDAPLLRFIANARLRGELRVLSEEFERQGYGLGLQQGSPLREAINRAILRILDDPSWAETVRRYMGD